MSTRLGYVTTALLLAFAAVACDPNTPPPSSAADAKDGGAGTVTAVTAAGGDTDTDGDGVPDKDDKCPDAKEDGVGSAPHDGCPNKPWSRQHGGPP